MDLRLNDDLVLVEEVEVRYVVAAEWLVPVVGDDSLSDLSVVLRVLLVKHHEEQIEAREK